MTVLKTALAALLVVACVPLAASGHGGPTGPDGAPRLPRPDEVLAGRDKPMALPAAHLMFGTPLDTHPAGTEIAYFGMGCFWGAEEHFFKLPGVVSTSVGYAGGGTKNPTYEEVSSGMTGHAEIVRVVYDPKKVSYEQLLKVFWEGHDPTQGMRQGNDVGTNYRSMILTTTEAQKTAAMESKKVYGAALIAAGRGFISTEIKDAGPFYFAEADHQQYCFKNPEGYCHHGGTGVKMPTITAGN